jgi:hypothetical protein
MNDFAPPRPGEQVVVITVLDGHAHPHRLGHGRADAVRRMRLLGACDVIAIAFHGAKRRRRERLGRHPTRPDSPRAARKPLLLENDA